MMRFFERFSMVGPKLALGMPVVWNYYSTVCRALTSYNGLSSGGR